MQHTNNKDQIGKKTKEEEKGKVRRERCGTYHISPITYMLVTHIYQVPTNIQCTSHGLNWKPCEEGG
jgi:hypothetical protein